MLIDKFKTCKDCPDRCASLIVTRPARDTFTESRLVKRSEKKKQSSGRFCLKGMKHTIPYLTILSDRRPLSAAQDTDAQKI